MKAVVQRVSSASVEVNQKVVGKINQGFLILLGVGQDDAAEDVEYLSSKISQMRIFQDELGKMNLDIQTVQGIVSLSVNLRSMPILKKEIVLRLSKLQLQI